MPASLPARSILNISYNTTRFQCVLGAFLRQGGLRDPTFWRCQPQACKTLVIPLDVWSHRGAARALWLERGACHSGPKPSKRTARKVLRPVCGRSRLKVWLRNVQEPDGCFLMPPRRRVLRWNPEYWHERLFKSSYTYNGKQKEVRHWSVKIQHQGTRKTFSLASSRRAQAAAEACQLYQRIVKHGWENLASRASRPRGPANPAPGGGISADAERLNPNYWEQRLIQREYTMSLQPKAQPELSVRVDHGGIGHYFPLGTEERKLAASRALEIYQAVVNDGWESANRRHRRELTLAFRWLDSPLAWTYTTIHTQNTLPPEAAPSVFDGATGVHDVAIAETDAGIRHALQWCVSHMEGFRCTAAFSSAGQALQELRQRPPRPGPRQPQLSGNAGHHAPSGVERGCSAGCRFALFR